MVTEPPPAAVDCAPFPAALLPLLFNNQRWVWFDEVIGAPLQTASITMFPAVVPVTATVGVPVLAAVTGVPSGVVWSTPVNDTDPALKWSTDVLAVTRTVFAPVA